MSDLQTWVKPNGTKVEINEDSVDAAKELGWREIEASVKDVDDRESRILALKTNLLSKEITAI